MATLLSCRNLTRTHAARPLFQSLSFGIAERERLGLIGPNGSGKSTLLRTLAGLEKPDSGDVSARRGLRVLYVPQEESFPEGASVSGVVAAALSDLPLEAAERAALVAAALADGGLRDPDAPVATLSGGWKKRLALTAALHARPDLLLLDEPTNHLDLEGVEWLEQALEESSIAALFVTHDRYFLENVATRLIELGPSYAEGYLSVEGAYSDFLEKREEYLAAQAHRQVALASQVRREIAWLRRGAQARSTKAKGRIEDAGEKIAELAELKRRNAAGARLEGSFTASGRKTKELLAAKNLSQERGGRTLFSSLDILLTPGLKLGIVGGNGAGKTTLLKTLLGELAPTGGTVTRAENLRVLWLDQERTDLPRDATLKDALSPNSDTVRFKGSQLHVSAWAKKFLFSEGQLGAKVATLSGGEQARIALANLMRTDADLLILDEPTNDLDIPSLDVLEEALLEFPGALVLVSHDRFLLERVCNQALLLEEGRATFFADYAQLDARRRERKEVPATLQKATQAAPKSSAPALTASERRELSQMEEKILAAEEAVAAIEAKMASPEVASDAVALQKLWSDDLPAARAIVEGLYARWQQLEDKKAATLR